MKNIYLQILDQQNNSPLVLATVTRTSGSTPQKPGSSALFFRNGIICGTVGGGVVEGKVQSIAIKSAQSKESGYFHFDLANDISKSEEAICGGQISVLVDANTDKHIHLFEEVRQSLEQHVPGVLITIVTGFEGKEFLIDRYWLNEKDKPEIPSVLFEKIEAAVNSLLTSARPHEFTEIEFVNPEDKSYVLFLLEPLFPPENLVIAGAGHIGRSLTHFGKLLDFNVTVIDDRSEYANKDNIPEAGNIIVKNIGEAMQELKKDRNTYVVIVTRGHKDDAEALRPCVGSGLAYVGMIGSRKKIATMREHFLEKGWATPGQWDKIYAPVGLDIKSQTVEEIAVSIAAQLILVRNSRKSEDRTGKGGVEK